MKFFSLLLILAAVAGAEWIDFGLDGLPSAEITVLEATPSGILAELVVPGIEINRITREGNIYHELSIPGTIPNTAGEGHPSIPSISFLAAVSNEGVSSITIENASWVDLGIYTPAPMQPIPADDSREAIPFTVVPSSYSGILPSQQASWISDGILRGVNVGRINISPIRWNAETGILSRASRMLVRIEFAGSVSIEQRLHSRFWNSTFQRTLVNASVLGSPVITVNNATSEPVKALNRRQADDITAADFLIIAGDDFVDTMMDSFIAAKMEQGFLTALVAGGSWSQTEIKAYVQNAYDTWTIPPSFVLFVGDSGDLIPYTGNGMSSDNRYCCVDGSDYMADIFNGRFVTGTDHYPGVEDKVLKWEFDPLMDSSFWNSGLCAGMLQATGNISTRWFLFTCETVRDTYQNIYGKTFDREYVKDTSAAPPYYYRNDLPSAGQLIPLDITWDGDTAGILSSINNGVFIVQHRNHGGVTGWSHPSFTISDFANLANGEKTPIVMSINCLTGKFVSNCFAENLFARDNGAVAVVAAVESSYSYFNDYFCYGVYKSFNDEYTSPPFTYTEPGGDYMGGQALINGKLEMQAAAPYNPYGVNWQQYAEDEWDLFQWFGDPTMDMRTDVPHSLTVTHTFYLPSGSTSAFFNVTDASGPVEQAMVCIQHPSGLWASGITDTSGNVTLTFDAIGAINDITFMVTAHNALPNEGFINGVGVEETSAGIITASVGNPYPNPAASSISFPITIDGAGYVDITVFDITGRTVNTVESGELESGSHALVWDVTEVPRGIYMARITSPGGSITTRRIVIAR